MLIELQRRRKFIIFGTLFGAWLGGMYAFWSQAVNWIALPGISLTAPGNNLSAYILQYALIGAVMGFITSLPHASAAGVALGGFLGAFAVTGLAVWNVWDQEDGVRTMILLIYTFLPLVVLFMPVAYLVRRGTDAQEARLGEPELWARRIIIPGLLTLFIVLLGSLSLHSSDERNAFYFMQKMIDDSRQVQSAEALPKSLLSVKDYFANAQQPFSLAWSDKVETFFGPRPATGEMSQFLIIATFKNGFRFACVFSRTTTVPNCTNY
jgi:hypothetical protein